MTDDGGRQTVKTAVERGAGGGEERKTEFPSCGQMGKMSDSKSSFCGVP